MLKGIFFTVLLVVATLPLAIAMEVVTHRFEIVLRPHSGDIQVVDHIEVPAALIEAHGSVRFSLNSVFSPAAVGVTLTRLPADPQQPDVNHYRVSPDVSRRFSLRYSGRLSSQGEFDSGHIGPAGVYLSGSAAWYPRFGHALHRFSMTVDLPASWQVVSQGESGLGPQAADWVESLPQDDIYLIAAPWSVFTATTPIAQAQVYLRDSDPILARRYLEATEQYLAFYTDLIGPYPYAKFALVENFWETGYGMPSFTLLGPQVIRLPFIIHTSYPHEILHNWWGNGVYIDYQDGNWSEGLTAYLADHLLRERRGLGADYRRDALQKYRSYVTSAEEFPLREFIGKHGEASEAIGYNKALMFFHMLRRRLGDQTFVAGLRHFYITHRFQRAGYRHLRTAFEHVSGESLQLMFDQWTRRVGAPALRLEDVRVTEVGAGFRLQARVRQTHAGRPYELEVPVVVQTIDDTQEISLRFDTLTKDFALDLEIRPLRVIVDPEFDVFRQLDMSELPVSLDELFGAEPGVAVIAGDAGEGLRDAYRQLAVGLGLREIKTDLEVVELPLDQVVWVLGWDSRHLSDMTDFLDNQPGSLSSDQAMLDTQVLDREENCVLLVTRRKKPARPIVFVGCDRAEITGAMAQRLLHYGNYSYLGFDANSGRNVVKGNWLATDSVMSVRLETHADLPELELLKRTALSEFPLIF